MTKMYDRTDRALDEVLREAAERRPEHQLFTFLENGENVGGILTYADLLHRSMAVGAQIAEVTSPGDRVLLLYEPSLDYVTAFFGCVLSGRTAVPVYPPNPSRLEQTLPRLMHIVEDSAPAAVATTALIQQMAEGFMSSMMPSNVAWCATDEASATNLDFPTLDPRSVAFLQYTSGSTSRPRGVRVTHRNLIDNVNLISHTLRLSEETVGISWLPMYHDMGLIGKIITPMVVGCKVVLMSPLDFLRRPLRWLHAVSNHGGTVSAAPNFAYDLCARKVTEEDLATMDLSTWRVALNAAEPVRSETIARFIDVFENVGFRREVFLPAYGLAESTLLVTGAMHGPTEFAVSGPALEEGSVDFDTRFLQDTQIRRLVTAGKTPPGIEVAIVDPESRRFLPENAVGEIWVCGESIADGYWGRAEQSEALFRARVSNAAPDDERTYLRTGDLGFLVGDELVVTGRRKDLIILRGRNIYPQDIEVTVGDAHEAVRPGGMAAFAVEEDGEEVLVIVAELERRTTAKMSADFRRTQETLPEHEVAAAPAPVDVAQTIREAVLEVHGIRPAHVVLIRPGSVPKTSSGKIQRHACREMFLSGGLEEVVRSSDEPSSREAIPDAAPELSLAELQELDLEGRTQRLEQYLVQLIAYVVQRGPSDIAGRSLMAAGIDSLAAMEVQYNIEARLGVRLLPSLLLGGATPRDVARELASSEIRPGESHDDLDDLLIESASFGDDGYVGMRASGDFGEDDRHGPIPTIEFTLPTDETEELSGNERGFWFYQGANPGSCALNIFFAARLPGGALYEGVVAAAQRVLSRHVNLRSRFHSGPVHPTRSYDLDSKPEFTRVDANGWSEERLKADFKFQARQPLDLRRGPIVRFRFYDTGAAPVLFFVIHHIGVDFWSLELLVRELGQQITGTPVTAAPSVTYADFIAWQGRFLTSERGRWCASFWREQLRQPPAPLMFPQIPGRTSEGFGQSHRRHISARLVKGVDRVAKANDTTRFAVLLAAYQALIGRWTGRSDFFVGAVAAGRTRRFFQDVLGMFANPLPLRTTLHPARKFSEHLAATAQNLLRAMDAQEYPLQEMLENFDLPRDTGANPLIQTLFASEQPREGGLVLGGTTEGLETLDLGMAGTPFDLTVMIHQSADGGEVRIQYNDQKFDAAAIEQMSDAYVRLIEAVISSPDISLGQLPGRVDSAAADAALARGVGPEVRDTPRPLHTMFEATAARFPDAVALEAHDGTWTYGQLNARANQFARLLASRGVKLESRVGVALDRSSNSVVAVLGILKAGGAFVPVERHFPRQHAEYVFRTAGVALVVADDDLAPLCEGELGWLRWGQAREQLATFGSEDLGVVTPPLAALSVLFTSGSTGRPKGVVMHHETYWNHIDHVEREFPVGRDGAVLWKTSLTFDLSTWEIFAPLAVGGRLVVPQPYVQADAAAMRDLIDAHRVTHVWFVPTQLNELVHSVDGSQCKSLRHVMSAGEVLTPELRDRFYQVFGAVLHNVYGPTEAYVVTAWQCPREVGAATSVPIGPSVQGLRSLVLDNFLEPVADSEVGEFYAAGIGLARGYVADPRRTAERFLPDPSGARGDRMYRTGDLARFVQDRGFEYLGRVDRQVKVRGNRVELEAVEAALETAAQVDRAVVLPILTADGSRCDRLIAFCTTREPATDDLVDGLRAHAAELLPEYAVPGQIEIVDAFPTTASGKIDRITLLKGVELKAPTSSGEAPITTLERTIAAAWKEHLGVERVGRHDNFFSLGGHSLLAVRIQHALSEALGVSLSLRDMFDHPTIADLARRLSMRTTQQLPLVAGAYKDEAPLSAEQRQMWILQALDPDSVTYQSPGVFRLSGPLDIDALKNAFVTLVQRHEILRTIYPMQGDDPVQKVLPPSSHFDIHVEDLRDQNDPELSARDRVREAIAVPFDLMSETSLRVSLYRLTHDEWVLCLLFHHIAIDEWTVEVLFDELSRHYRSRREAVSGDPDDSRVDDWEVAFDVAYRALPSDAEDDPTFRIDGWTSSYTNERYSREEMRDWLDGWLEQIRTVELRRTLEIGCGTGMLLFELAPEASEYVALDFSDVALTHVERTLQTLDRDYSRVELIKGRADELDLVEGQFDTIIINSVVQYFPSLAYFNEVVAQACQRLAPGGTLIVGDIRDSRNTLAFHASVVRQRGESTDRRTLRSVAASRVLRDDELCLSPQQLASMVRGLPGISHVDFVLPRARHWTEMSRYRYAAMFRKGPQAAPALPERVLTWGQDVDLERLSHHLNATRAPIVLVGVPNARVAKSVQLAAWMFGDDLEVSIQSFTGDDLWNGVHAEDPDSVRQIGEGAGYRVIVSPSTDDFGVHFDAVFVPSHYRGTTPFSPLSASSVLPGLPTLGRALPAEIQGVSLAKIWSGMMAQPVVREREEFSDSSLEIPRIQYADYAIWQRDRFASQEFRDGIDYWRASLAGARDTIDWPKVVGEGKGGASYLQHAWGSDVSKLVQATAQRHRTTEFVVLYAAFTWFLSKYAKQGDLTIGVGTTMRQRSEFKELVGYLLNMLPMRAPIGDTTFERWLEMAKRQWNDSREHHWIPLEQIVEAVAAERRAGDLPLYDVMFTYVPRNLLRRSSADSGHWEKFSDLRFRPFDYGGVPDALCSLFVTIFKNDDRLATEFEYDAGRFNERVARDMAQAFERTTLDVLRGDEEAPVLPDDRDVPAIHRGRGPRFLAWRDPIHKRFEMHAANTPQAVSLRFEGGEWTFRELNQRANAIAHAILARGVSPGERVGVSLTRSPELIAALLGVLKAGCAYVPLEPELPKSRLDYLAEDSDCRVILADRSGLKALGDMPGRVVIEAHADGRLEPRNPDISVAPGDMAYMMYTSGTTGAPKGVMVPHVSVANHVAWLETGCGVTFRDVFLLKSTYGFDMCISEIFGPLCTGGVMGIAKPDGQRDPAYLVDVVARFGVTCLRVVPTTLNLMLTEPGVARIGEKLRWVMLGGEALTQELQDTFLDTFPKVELHNPYGITETCVDVTYWVCPRAHHGKTVSLGNAMGNYDVYVLDPRAKPVADHTVGEVMVGGVGVSYGYWRKARRTALAFLPNPYAAEPGARMYASGDLARWTDDNLLTYSGRRDDQVQLFGVRLELGEVEANLEAAPGVKVAAVRALVHADNRAEGLIAYVVLDDGATTTAAEIRAFLTARLRREAVPTQYVFLNEMPRKPSGKIDRSALPEPSALPAEKPVEFAVTADGANREERIHAIWTAVLNVSDVGLDANFFEVGGTSLKAIQVYRRLKTEFGVEFEVVELFEHTTIRKLAKFLDAAASSGAKLPDTDEDRDRRAAMRRDAQRGVRRRRNEREE